jgi:hypothetical protein
MCLHMRACARARAFSCARRSWVFWALPSDGASGPPNLVAGVLSTASAQEVPTGWSSELVKCEPCSSFVTQRLAKAVQIATRGSRDPLGPSARLSDAVQDGGRVQAARRSRRSGRGAGGAESVGLAFRSGLPERRAEADGGLCGAGRVASLGDRARRRSQGLHPTDAAPARCSLPPSVPQTTSPRRGRPTSNRKPRSPTSCARRCSAAAAAPRRGAATTGARRARRRRPPRRSCPGATRPSSSARRGRARAPARRATGCWRAPAASGPRASRLQVGWLRARGDGVSC